MIVPKIDKQFHKVIKPDHLKKEFEKYHLRLNTVDHFYWFFSKQNTFFKKRNG